MDSAKLGVLEPGTPIRVLQRRPLATGAGTRGAAPSDTTGASRSSGGAYGVNAVAERLQIRIEGSGVTGWVSSRSTSGKVFLVPTVGRLSVRVQRATELRNMDGLLGKNDPFVKLSLAGPGELCQSVRTKTHDGAGAEAKWDEGFSMDVYDCHALEPAAASSWPAHALRIVVTDEDMLGDDDVIGECIVPLALAVGEARARAGGCTVPSGVKRCAWLELRAEGESPTARPRY